MTTKTELLFALTASSLFALGGCAVDATSGDGADDAPVAETADALSSKASLVGGAWTTTNGSPFARIVFTSDARQTLAGVQGFAFSATVVTPIYCFTTPCPQPELDVAGVYRITRGKLELMSFDKPGRAFATILGTYDVSTARGALTLRKVGAPALVARFAHSAPHCLRYETTDESGVPLHNVYAENYPSKAAANLQLRSFATNAINAAVTEGSCKDLGGICPMNFSPVCGEPAGGEPSTSGNLCAFKADIAERAGHTGSAKGHYQAGTCAKLGEPCGGFIAPFMQHVCIGGLACVLDVAHQNPDAGGTCQPVEN